MMARQDTARSAGRASHASLPHTGPPGRWGRVAGRQGSGLGAATAPSLPHTPPGPRKHAGRSGGAPARRAKQAPADGLAAYRQAPGDEFHMRAGGRGAPEVVGALVVRVVRGGSAEARGQAQVDQVQALRARPARRAQQKVLRLDVAVHIPARARAGWAPRQVPRGARGAAAKASTGRPAAPHGAQAGARV